MDAHRIATVASLFIFEILFLNLAVTLVEKRAREMVTHYLWRMSLSKTKKKFYLNLSLSFSVSILAKTFPNIAVQRFILLFCPESPFSTYLCLSSGFICPFPLSFIIFIKNLNKLGISLYLTLSSCGVTFMK